MNKIIENLEQKLKKTGAIRRLTATGLILAATFIGGYSIGKNVGDTEGYNACTAQQIRFEQNVKTQKYQDIFRVNNKYFLALSNDKVCILNREGQSETWGKSESLSGEYDKIKVTDKGYECKWTSALGRNWVGVYVDYLNQDLDVDSTKSFTKFN